MKPTPARSPGWRALALLVAALANLAGAAVGMHAHAAAGVEVVAAAAGPSGDRLLAGSGEDRPADDARCLLCDALLCDEMAGAVASPAAPGTVAAPATAARATPPVHLPPASPSARAPPLT